MNYVETVADLLHQRNSYRILDAADYVLIAEWEKEEIPLDVVINSINESLHNTRKPENAVDINSVGYFQEKIRKNFAVWLQKQFAVR